MTVRGPNPGRARSKVALVCGGGGITGGVFEVGALRALDQALGGGVVQKLDLYVGASAGGLVSAMLAAGLPPAEIHRLIVTGARNKWDIPPLARGSIYSLDWPLWVAAAAKLPVRMGVGFFRSLLPGEGSRPADALFEALRGLPAGIFSNAPLGRYAEQVLRSVGRGVRFDDLDRPLYVTAVNVDTGHRVVFGDVGARDVPVPLALQASAALPLVFSPVRIDGQDFVDGGVERNVPADVAVQHGATLVIALNPLVPVVNDPRASGSLMQGYRFLSDGGLSSVVDQVFRMMVRNQVQYGLREMQSRFPEVDIVLFEPEAHDAKMFSHHPMRYSVREEIAQHAYETTRDRLLQDADHLSTVFARHGLRFEPDRLKGRSRRRPDEGRGAKAARALGRLPIVRRWMEGQRVDHPF